MYSCARVRMCVSGVALTATLALAPAASAATYTDPGAVDQLVQRLTRPPSAVSLPALPREPVATLVAAVNAHSASLGVAVDHGPAIRAAGDPTAYAGRVALLMQAVLACRGGEPPRPSGWIARRRPATRPRASCARRRRLRRRSGLADPLHRRRRRPEPYVHDYTVLIDRGGNDTYDNNAGGNLQDITFGPRRLGGPENRAGDRLRAGPGQLPAPTATAHDCIAAPQVGLHRPQRRRLQRYLRRVQAAADDRP